MIRVESLIVIQTIIKVIRPIHEGSFPNTIDDHVAEYLQSIYVFSLKKSTDTDSEFAVREQGKLHGELIIALSCLSTVLCHARDILPNSSIREEVVPLILNRLQNESYRISSLRFINDVSSHLEKDIIDFSEELSSIYDQISIFLRKSYRPLLIQSLECLIALIKRYNSITEPVKMLNDLRNILDEMDTHLFTLALSAVNHIIRICKQDLVSDTIQLTYVPKIMNALETHPHLWNLETLKAFWTAFTSIGGIERIKFCLEKLDETSLGEKYAKMVFKKQVIK